MNKDEIYREVLAKAKKDPSVIGLILGGGRGKGVITEHSDYDLIIIVKDDAKERAIREYEKAYNATAIIEGHVRTLEEFKKFGTWGTEEDWQAYNFAHLKASIDKTGEIQKLIEIKGKIPEGGIKGFVTLWLDGFINQHYRAFKNHRDGNMFAAHLDAVESIPMLLNVVFGREGRLRPYNKFLEWELKNYPLRHLPWSREKFIEAIERILRDGDIETMKEFYRKLKETSIEMGYEGVIKGWDGYKLE